MSATASLLVKYKAQLQKFTDEIENFPYTVDISSIENDPKLVRDEQVTSQADPVSNLSLFQLNAQVKEHDEKLECLNKLWLIRGLSNEIENSLNDPSVCTELESVFFNLNKFHQKLSEFRELYPSALIVDKLFEHHDRLYDDALDQIRLMFVRFFPDNSTFVNPVVVNGVEIEYNGEFVAVFSTFTERNKSDLIIGKLLHEKQVSWDKLLDIFITKRSGYVELTKQEQGECLKYEISTDSTAVELSAKYFQALTAFIRFINLFENQSLQNFYLSKISRNLTEIISQNIDMLMNNKSLVDQLVDVLELSKRTNWSLTVSSSLTLGNIVDNLNELWMDWTIDAYVDKIREFFNSRAGALIEEFSALGGDGKRVYSRAHAIAPSELGQPQTASKEVLPPPQEDAWAEDDSWEDGWDDEDAVIDSPVKQKKKTKETEQQAPRADHEEDEDEWDAWEEEIDFDDSPKKPKKVDSIPIPLKQVPDKTPQGERQKSTDLGFLVTDIPTELIQILQSFVDECSETHRIEGGPPVPKYELLVTSILAFSHVTYPPLERSFILYNDLVHLYENSPIASSEVIEFADALFSKLQLDLLPFISGITRKINLEHDDYVRQRNEFELDPSTCKEIASLQVWFGKFLESKSLLQENNSKFQELLIYFIDYINNWLINSIIQMKEVTEYQSQKLNSIIHETVLSITLPIAVTEIDSKAETSIKSFHRLENVQFLISNHLSNIMERFYSGEFYDLESDEIINVINSVFVKSELRDGYIQEILDIRNIDNE